MTTFFSLDVETSGLTPWDGYLLTIGVQPVLFDVETQAPSLSQERFYVRIDRSELLDQYGWTEPGVSDTYAWWMEQNEEAKREAWLDPDLLRHSAFAAAEMLHRWVVKVEPEQKNRIFVANPVSFDKMWIDALYGETGLMGPFHYQSLCLRSMKFGLRKKSSWGSSRDNHDPKVPHHAFHDAYAQALDLIVMLNERDAMSLVDEAVA